MDYETTIRTLFDLLRQANEADDTQIRQPWQRSSDASQDAYYGHIWNAIAAIAGKDIVYHHSDTWEIDLTLANRH